jgi:chromosome segregation ATPase
MTREEVEQAVNELEAQGLKASVRNVREKIGRGSLTDINRILGDIRRDQEMALQPQHQMPESLRIRADSLVTALWLAMSSEAQRDIVEARAVAHRKVDSAEAALAASLADADELLEELDVSRQQVADLTETLHVERHRCTDLERQLAVAVQRLTDAADNAVRLQETLERLASRRELSGEHPASESQAAMELDNPPSAPPAPRRPSRPPPLPQTAIGCAEI